MSGTQPVGLTLETTAGTNQGLPLSKWIERDGEFRGQLRLQRRAPEPGTLGIGEIVLTGLFAPASILGLMRLVREWLDLQRGKVKVKVTVGDTNVEVELSGRFDVERAAAEIIQEAKRTDLHGSQ